MSRSVQIVIACEDPAVLTEFWAPALGYIPQPPPEGFSSWDEFADAVGVPEDRRKDFGAVVDPDGVGPRLLFERYDGGEPNQRVHFDINVIEGEVDKETGRAILASGAGETRGFGGSIQKGGDRCGRRVLDRDVRPRGKLVLRAVMAQPRSIRACSDFGATVA